MWIENLLLLLLWLSLRTLLLTLIFCVYLSALRDLNTVCVFHWLIVRACYCILFFFIVVSLLFFSLFLFFFSFSLSRIRLCWGILSRDTLNYSGIKALRQKTWKKRRAFLYCWILGGNSWEGCTHWPCQEGSLLGIKVSNSYLHVHTLLSHKKLT